MTNSSIKNDINNIKSGVQSLKWTKFTVMTHCTLYFQEEKLITVLALLDTLVLMISFF